MIKREKSIDFTGQKFYQKYFPSLFLVFMIGALALVIFIRKGHVQSQTSNPPVGLMFHAGADAQSSIQPLTVESTRLFYFMVQTLQDLQLVRCDLYLPDRACLHQPNQNETTKSFYELRQAVVKTAAGYQDAGRVPPYHTLKSLVVNTGNPNAKYIGVLIYTGKDGWNHSLKVLHILKMVLDKNNSCKPAPYSTWFFIEDPFSFEILQDNYGIKITDTQNHIQVFKKKSVKDFSPSVGKPQKLDRYLPENIDPEFLPCPHG